MLTSISTARLVARNRPTRFNMAGSRFPVDPGGSGMVAAGGNSRQLWTSPATVPATGRPIGKVRPSPTGAAFRLAGRRSAVGWRRASQRRRWLLIGTWTAARSCPAPPRSICGRWPGSGSEADGPPGANPRQRRLPRRARPPARTARRSNAIAAAANSPAGGHPSEMHRRRAQA